ncbi:Mariner Mos1 transposase, partial [Anthophora retusa]
MICSALGENAVTYKTCKKWFQRFRSGNFDLNDAERSGTPKKVEDEELEQLLNEDPCQTQHELAEELGVTQQAISVRLKKLGRVQKVGLISSLGWEILLHAAYSPDMAPSDYHLFRSLQHHLVGSHFKSLEEVGKSMN